MEGDVFGNVATTLISWAAIAAAVSVLWRTAPVRWFRDKLAESLRKWIMGIVTDVLNNGNHVNQQLDDIKKELARLSDKE